MVDVPESLSKNLALDEWYKLFIWLGVIGFFAALYFPIKITLISNNGLLISSFGLFLIGIGEWAKWKYTPEYPIHGCYSYVLNTKNKIAYVSKRSTGIEDLAQLFGLFLLAAPFIMPFILPMLPTEYSVILSKFL